ncbi:MAG: 5-aminopentanamidase [Myxococcaceae bacterium]|nr:5-aminopentanamidase [Myxococcaceae bacterium]
MRVTVLELPATWGDPQAALAAVASELERGPATDLVLLPEASLSGYVSATGDFDLAAFAEPIDGPTARAVAALARRHRVHLVAPLVLAEEGRHYNAMVAFDRDGEPVFTYRKRHPWFPETWASAGPLPAPTVAIEGVRVTIAVCFDVHFLREDAADALDAADLLLFPSAWVEEEDSRASMLAALARRHRIAVANANWGPGVVRIAGQGGSSVLDAGGSVLARVTPRVMRADAVVTADLTRSAIPKAELTK